MNEAKILKDFIIQQLRLKLHRIKQDIEPFPSPPPDLKIQSYGITVGYIDIVVEPEVSTQRIEKWKEIVASGEKLILIISKADKLKITELLWREGVAEKISIGTYEFNLLLP